MIWSNEVAKLLSVMGGCSRMSFLLNRKSWASFGVWVEMLSALACCVEWELVCRC